MQHDLRIALDQITHAEIEALLPHKGRMCLLERVLAFDDSMVTCASTSHRQTTNPLLTARGVSSSIAVEYGAQAAAVHRGLLARDASNRDAPRRGLLVQIREVQLHTARLDTQAANLIVRAWRWAEVGGAVQYRFDVRAAADVIADVAAEPGNSTPIAEGELLVVLS
jgi:predicted hotdog family 3-hydroxylacyl-ACP dehydratase